MPGITGQVVILTVSDAHRSAAWYRDLLGMEETSRYIQPDGDVALVHLLEPRSGVELALVHHQSVQAAFDEFRPGLDHLDRSSP
jgi:glyoxylase I family protein